MRSAGLLPFRRVAHLEVLIAHPGGPLWAKRDAGAWSVVKGVVENGEPDIAAARREFTEETGWPAPNGPLLDLGDVRLASRKTVTAWAVEADFDPRTLIPGTFEMWGRAFPEIDRVEWFQSDAARRKLNPVQSLFIDRLELMLAGDG